jgi:pSer/pThr/pTyr-binding forkhead associated (FHA) protein
MDDFFQEYLEETVVALDKPPSSPHLEIRNGPEDGRVYVIVTETVRIGRQLPDIDKTPTGESVGNFVIRTDKAISREHCELTALSSSTFLLKDLDSRFGTELNGVRISTPTPCRHGDTITIGDTTLMLRSQD